MKEITKDDALRIWRIYALLLAEQVKHLNNPFISENKRDCAKMVIQFAKAHWIRQLYLQGLSLASGKITHDQIAPGSAFPHWDDEVAA